MNSKRPPDRLGDLPEVSSATPLTRGDGQPTDIIAPCPVCASPDARLRTILLEVPFFGEVFESVFLCAACGFRHADTLLPRIQEPTEFTIRVEGDRDLFVRAVKSSSATVELPELGLLWEPGPASIAEVTNVEGLIRHFVDAVARAKALFPAPEAQSRAAELTQRLEALVAGKEAATLVLKDPYGNSALIGEAPRVTRRVLPAAEAEALDTGEYVLEAAPDGRPTRLRPARDSSDGTPVSGEGLS